MKEKDEKVIKKNIEFNLVEVVVIILITGILTSVFSGLIVFNNYDTILSNTADQTSESSIQDVVDSYNHIINSYVKEVDSKGLIDAAIEGMYSYLNDEYSIYMDKDVTSSLNEQLNGEYEGIGIEITMNADSQIVINRVFSGSPAEAAGLKSKDIITALDNEDLTGKTSSYVADTIKKNSKSSFDITYVRDGVSVTVTIERKKINIEYVNSEVYNETIGYISIDMFSSTATQQVKDKLDSFDKKVNTLIVDVRDDSGGYLTTAYEIADLFIEKGKAIYQLKDKESNISKYYAKSGVYKKFNKIVVLIDGGSASASEILALALKESAGATIVGNTSYGKGTVQETEYLSSGAMVKYTTAYWLGPNGTSINETGINPDVFVTDNAQQLQKAIELCK